MALIFNEGGVASEPAGNGARRQRLLTAARVPGTAILLDRIALDAGAETALAVPSGSVAWLQGLDGAVTLTHAGGEAALSKANVALLPPGFAGTLRAAHRKVYLYAPMDEHKVFTAGSTPTVVHVDGIGQVGLSTCFDGDHPAYARQLRHMGARVVIEPCAYETAAESWWDVLYPANALANGQWWVMVNQCGGELLGKSRIIAPDGSITAEAGSGISFMSDSLITFQPAIEEPSNMMPSAKASSSISLESMVTCCILPRGSVKRRSTNLTSSSLIFFVTLLASAIVLPCHWH